MGGPNTDLPGIVFIPCGRTYEGIGRPVLYPADRKFVGQTNRKCAVFGEEQRLFPRILCLHAIDLAGRRWDSHRRKSIKCGTAFKPDNLGIRQGIRSAFGPFEIHLFVYRRKIVVPRSAITRISAVPLINIRKIIDVVGARTGNGFKRDAARFRIERQHLDV